MSRQRTLRNSKGASTVALILVFAFCVILPLGLFAFELSRFFLIEEELHNITDSAALAGTAAMASSPSPPTVNSATGAAWTANDRQYTAMVVAAETFAQNSVLQTQFALQTIPASSDGTPGYTTPNGTTSTNVVANFNPSPPQTQSPSVHNATLNILLTNSSGTQVTIGNPAAQIQVQAYYSDAPVFLGTLHHGNMFVNLGTTPKYTVEAISNGGLPTIDIMLAFDVSGSMDDETNVTFINRFWYGGGTNQGPQVFYGYTMYQHTNFLGDEFLEVPPEGTQVNVFPPQHLSYCNYPATYARGMQNGGNVLPFCFSETAYDATIMPNASYLNGLRAADKSTIASQWAAAGTATWGTWVNHTTATMPEAGLPPGNLNPNYPTAWRWTSSNPTNADGSLTANGLDPTLGNNLNGGVFNYSTGKTGEIWCAPDTGLYFNNGFTDLVVAPQNDVGAWSYFAGFPITVTNNGSTYTFQNCSQILEAERGNCETTAILKQALGGKTYWTSAFEFYNSASGSGSTFTPQSGYFNAAWLYTLQTASPISQAQTAAYNFFETMHISANSHFGMETFAGSAATLSGTANGDSSVTLSGAGTTEAMINMPWYDSNYLSSSFTINTPLPCIALNQSSDNFNLITGSFLPSSISQYPPTANPDATLTSNLPLVPTTGTDIADALNQAVTIMNNSTYVRATAKKALILFTDGVPNEPTSALVGYNDAITQAQQAGSYTPVIPIYTIGLSQNTTILPLENNLLGDGQSNGSGGTNPQGIAYYSAPNTARYYSVTNPLNMESAFQQIARSLCVIE
jgi:Flp pilus assembly protein TadG